MNDWRIIVFLLGLVLFTPQLAPARNLSGTGTVSETYLHENATLVRVTFSVPVWRANESHKVVEGCAPGEELHNAGFLVSTKVRRTIRLTNSRFILGESGEWLWSWYLVNGGVEARDQEIEVSFVCLGGAHVD